MAGSWGRRHRPGVHGAEGLSGCPALSNLAFVRALARGDRAALVWWRVAPFLVFRWGGCGGRAPWFDYGDFVRDHAAPGCFDRLVYPRAGVLGLGAGSGADLVGVVSRLCLPVPFGVWSSVAWFPRCLRDAWSRVGFD